MGKSNTVLGWVKLGLQCEQKLILLMINSLLSTYSFTVLTELCSTYRKICEICAL